MSRRNKQKRKLKQQRDKHARRSGGADRQPRGVYGVVQRASLLLEQGDVDEARELLEAEQRRGRAKPESLRLLLDIHHEQRDYVSFCRTCRQLLERSPGDPHLQLMLAGGYLSCGRPAAALRQFRKFVEQAPDDPLLDGIGETIAGIEPLVEELLRSASFAPIPAAERLELAALHDEALASLDDGDNGQCAKLEERLLARWPEFLPARNNLSEAYFRAGQGAKALAMSRQVLAADPENFHALSNLTRHLLLCGRRDQAREFADRLRRARSDRHDFASKRVEAFSFLGDDEAVLEAFEEAKRSGLPHGAVPELAMLYHLAAVAAARQGRLNEARQLWDRALKHRPGFQLAQENLADARLPSEKRHGPWPFDLHDWIAGSVIEELIRLFKAAAQKSENAVEKAARKFCEAHPEVVGLLPELLERGGEGGRGFAIRLIKLAETPELLEVLRQFCGSSSGPDELRMEAATFLCRQGVLSGAQMRMWLQGEWREIELFGFEITHEPVGPVHCDEVDDWSYNALQALKRRDGAEAQALLEKCLAREPDSPDLLNNLAKAYSIQGREDEARRLSREIHERWPDYFFGRITMANLSTLAGDYEQAEAYLTPLRSRARLHVTEFTALCSAYVQLFQARGKYDAAERWLEMWEQIDPDNPQLGQLRRRMSPSHALGNLKSWAGNALSRFW